jgi:hypothetical protein
MQAGWKIRQMLDRRVLAFTAQRFLPASMYLPARARPGSSKVISVFSNFVQDSALVGGQNA